MGSSSSRRVGTCQFTDDPTNLSHAWLIPQERTEAALAESSQEAFRSELSVSI